MLEKKVLTQVHRLSPVGNLRDRVLKRLSTIPWWLVAIFVIAILVAWLIITRPVYREAFNFIRVGLVVTITTTLIAYLISIAIGLITGLARISSNIVFRNISTFYVEVVRGIPMLVLIFTIALVIVPMAINGIIGLGESMTEAGLINLGNFLSGFKNDAIPMNVRAIIALAITYGAFSAEIFRAGIQSIGRGQMEAARSQGMSYAQAMRYVILPQAIRNVLPALGNDFVSMLKDSSLVSVLAVRDITQIAKLYSGRTFQYEAAYTILAVLYLTMTIILSFVVKALEKRMGNNEPA